MKEKKVVLLIGLFFSLASSQQASLTGKVTLYDGSTPVESVLVVIENNGNPVEECYTDAVGNYTMSIPSGNYSQLRVRNLWKKINGIPYLFEYTAKTNIVIGEGTNTEDISLPRFYEISGVVLTSKGDTIKGARVECGTAGGVAPPQHYDSSSIIDGSYKLLNIEGNIRITVTPPEGYNVQKSFFDITLKSDTIFNLILKTTVTINGIVVNGRNDTLKGIGVTFEKIDNSWQKDTFTDENGRYSVTLTADTYNIRIRNGTLPFLAPNKNRGIPHYLEEKIATNISFEKDTTLDITLPFYPMLRCSVITLEGVAVSNLVLSASGGSLPSTPPADYDTTDNNGLCTLFVVSSLPLNLWSGTSPNLQTQLNNLIITKDTTLLLTLKKSITLSGKVYLSDSVTTVKNIGIALEEGSNQIMSYTDDNGYYTVTIAEGIYRLRVRNSGLNFATDVPQNLEHTVFEKIKLDSSKII
ncbi:MAG: carboxypeptidase-like regulatory domain-containing protein, partial [Chitinispirillaceae bacterium]|nr:carboxypeptidase-like regulatory domain-containing protein [Chitinispirillaceae bacterium]